MKTPRGLGPAGKKFWTRVVDEFRLEPHEELLLEQVCKTVDIIAALEKRLAADADVIDESYGGRAHPALPELRAQRLALARLLKSLHVDTDAEQPKRQRRRWPNGNYGVRGVVS